MGIRVAVCGVFLLASSCGGVGGGAHGPQSGVVVQVQKPRGAMPSGASETVRRAVERAVEEGAPDVRVARSSGGSGYVLSTRVARLKVKKRRGAAHIDCAVTVRVARQDSGHERWRGGETANATASGEVSTGRSKSAIAEASRECVVTVAESLTRREVVPFLRQSIRLAARDSDSP